MVQWFVHTDILAFKYDTISRYSHTGFYQDDISYHHIISFDRFWHAILTSHYIDLFVSDLILEFKELFLSNVVIRGLEKSNEGNSEVNRGTFQPGITVFLEEPNEKGQGSCNQ